VRQWCREVPEVLGPRTSASCGGRTTFGRKSTMGTIGRGEQSKKNELVNAGIETKYQKEGWENPEDPSSPESKTETPIKG